MKGSMIGLLACSLVNAANGQGMAAVDANAILDPIMVASASNPGSQPPIMQFTRPDLGGRDFSWPPGRVVSRQSRDALDEMQKLRPPRDDARGAGLLIEVDIKPQPMGEALIEWAEQTDLNLIADAMQDEFRLTHGVKGIMTAIESLELLVKGTGLQYVFAGPRLVIVKDPYPNRFVPRSPPVSHEEDE